MSALHCCVPHCSNDSRYDPEKLLSFHRFPKESKLRKEWIVRIRRDVGQNFQITDSTRVCSAHFKEEDISKTLTGIQKRKDNAVPSIFSWSDTTPKRLAPRRRCPEFVHENKEDEAPSTSSPDFTSPSSDDHDYAVPSTSDRDMLLAAQSKITQLESKTEMLRNKTFFLERFSGDPHLINFYTGFTDYATLTAVFHVLKPTASNMVRWTQVQRHSRAKDEQDLKGDVFRDESLPLIDQFFMFLTRVRQGFFEEDLSVRFGVSQSTVSRMLITWANYLYITLGCLPIWPTKELCMQHMPQCFIDTYPNTRVILDCTEIKVQTPSSKVLNSEIYSSYKSHSTFKGLVGISSFGAVIFVSSLYTGAISDKAITASSGILNLLDEGDQVMADKGFVIQDLLSTKKSSLIIPPFLGSKGKFSASEVADTQKIARLRIHVERAIRRVKEYHLFDSVVPLTLAGSVNQLWTVCAILTNFRGPLF